VRCMAAPSTKGAESAVIGVDGVFRSGAPRSMKMGTTRSPFPYDAVARHALQWANLRRPAILRYASHGRLSSRFRRVVRLPFDSGPHDRSRDRRDGPAADLEVVTLEEAKPGSCRT
jgi:hypothetical protein